MAIQPEGGDWSQWLTLAFSVIISTLSSVGVAGFFVGSTKKEIETLKADRDELRADIRTAVHDMRNELHKVNGSSAKVDDIRRLEGHLDRQDEKAENFRNQVVALILNGRKTNGS
jgi:hypothetical protein